MTARTTDVYIEAARSILETPLLAYKVEQYIDGDRWDFPRLLADAEVWSSGEQILVRLAAELFNSRLPRKPVHISELVETLDEQNFEVAITAIRMLRPPAGGRW